jgi:hypothetical protein
MLVKDFKFICLQKYAYILVFPNGGKCFFYAKLNDIIINQFCPFMHRCILGSIVNLIYIPYLCGVKSKILKLWIVPNVKVRITAKPVSQETVNVISVNRAIIITPWKKSDVKFAETRRMALEMYPEDRGSEVSGVFCASVTALWKSYNEFISGEKLVQTKRRPVR